MAAVTSKYSTNSGYEATNHVECRVLTKNGLYAPRLETDIGDTIVAVDGLSPNLVVLHVAEAQLLRSQGLVDF